MQNNDYDIIINRLKDVLLQLDPPLKESTIQEKVSAMKELLDNSKALRDLYQISYEYEMSENEWLSIERELEMHFNVQMEDCFLIQGEEQQKRNNKWWTEDFKYSSELYFWSRYKDYIKKLYQPNVVTTIDTDTDAIMNNIANPEENRFSRYGMVVGHVQSGKTANYSALINKACDAGYKFIIVIAGGIKNLRNQTQVRINEAIIGKQGSISVGVGKYSGYRLDLAPSSLTTADSDFDKQYANKIKHSINLDVLNVPIIMVIKKDTNTLSNVIDWLKANYKNGVTKHAMLMIDDESDYASINTKKENNPSTINRNLRELLDIFNKKAYIAYTATPYANIFIDHKVNNEYGRDLFPRDFIVALNAPDNYTGARKFFIENNTKHIIHIKDSKKVLPLHHKKDTKITSIPQSLKEAIRVFIINIAVRDLGNQKSSHNSMLVHVSRYTAIHDSIKFYIEEYLDSLKDEIISFGRLSNCLSISDQIRDIKETFYKVHNDIKFSWSEILEQVCNIIRTIKVMEVHQKANNKLEYSKNKRVNVIAVGGTSLSRGFTLEGLSVSYFMRTTKMYDTLMQMGRWFGYRVGYDNICKVYMTKEMEANFAFIIESTEDLFDDFRRMGDANLTPKDFGLSVKQHPNSALQVTAYNKLRHTKDYYFEMKLDGTEKETTYLMKEKNIRDNNLKAIKDLIYQINLRGNHKLARGIKNLWIDADKEDIIKFLDSFIVYTKNPLYNTSKMPIDFIRTYALQIDTKWDVMLASGQSNTYTIQNIDFDKELRNNVEDKDDYLEANRRRVSSDLSEKYLFDKHRCKGKNGKDLRAMMRKPLLVLHVLDIVTDKGENFENMAAFSISFPGGINSGQKVIKHKINSVFVKQILDDFKEESDSDD